jgi:hypothetical protein
MFMVLYSTPGVSGVLFFFVSLVLVRTPRAVDRLGSATSGPSMHLPKGALKCFVGRMLAPNIHPSLKQVCACNQPKGLVLSGIFV